MNEDSRRQEVIGQKLYLETDNPNNSDFGPEAFAIKGTNDDGCRFVLAHHESNTTRIESEGDILLNAGVKSKNFGTSLNVISHGGDIQVNSTMAGIGIKASDELILEADKIILKANKIQIGDQFSHGTKEITLNVIHDSNYFGVYDSVDGIIALGWEHIPEDFDGMESIKRLAFHYGETLKSVSDKLYSRDIILIIYYN